MPEAALYKVQARYKALLDTIPGLHTFIDRSDAEPLDESERPAVSIRVPSVQFEPGGQEEAGMRYQMRHRAAFQFDFVSANMAGETIDAVNQAMIARFVALLAADPTLGGMVESSAPQAASGSEHDGADVGTAILEIQSVFYTPEDDWFTVIGMGGVTF
ncbi:MAG: hypothetical protein DI547_04955 [Sphingobium sp.]|nr:MAG: hypothetical protein DI547_04955 [Sphingobium sp.]